MAISRTEIFIASRFGEFEEIRRLLREKIALHKAIPIEAVDFGDGRMSPHPPLRECLAAVNRAEIMILLLGDTYGEPAPDQPRRREPPLSYTHLEYREALREDTRTLVLPFLFGADPDARRPPPSAEPGVAEFYDEVMKGHICKFLRKNAPASDLVEEIFHHTMACFIRLSQRSAAGGATEDQGEDVDDEGDDGLSDAAGEQELSSDELAWLEANYERRAAGVKANEADDDEEAERTERLLREPARAAAAEQMQIGFEALKLGERFLAMRHFRRCLDNDPLNARASYWLARILATTQKPEHSEEAIRLADRAIRIAARDGASILAAVNCIVAARCCSNLRDNEGGIRYAKEACSWTPKLARAHIELAAQYALVGRAEDAGHEIRRAFKAYPRIIHVADRDPAFRTIAHEYEGIRRAMGRQLQDRLDLLHGLETRLRSAFELEPEPAEGAEARPAKGLVGLASAIRQAGKGQLALLQSIANRLLALGEDLTAADAKIKAERRATEASAATQLVQLRRWTVGGGAAALAALAALVLHPLLATAIAIVAVALLARAYGPFRDLRRARAGLEEVERQEQALQPGRARFEEALATFEAHVLAFERNVTTDGLASPVRRRHRPRPGDVLVVRHENDVPVLLADPADQPEGDWAVIPPALRPTEAPEIIVPPKHPCLVRIAAGSHTLGKRKIARWGAYFTDATEATGRARA
jgi:tetratricopeptide (TPR) repeat protein